MYSVLNDPDPGPAGEHDLFDAPNYEPETGQLFTWVDRSSDTAFVRWTFRWDDDHHMSSLDYYAQDLYMLNEDGTFIDIITAKIIT